MPSLTAININYICESLLYLHNGNMQISFWKLKRKDYDFFFEVSVPVLWISQRRYYM